MGGIISKTPYRITVDIAPELWLETYPGRLEQILQNLIQNAIIHGLEGAATGFIHLSAQGSSDDSVALSVSDTGKGITPANLTRVFDPFFTTRLGQGGSEMGLHIAYSLATGILGGSISVISPAGAGAQFTLTLPRVAPAPAERSPSEAFTA